MNLVFEHLFSSSASRRAALWLLAGLMLAVACRPLSTPASTPASPPAPSPTSPASPATPDEPTPTGGPAAARVTLRLWTSPEAAPDEATPGGQVLAGQLAAFEQANPGVTVEVRVKKTAGVGGLLDFLRTTSVAAPAALPDVIALSRDDLVAAAGEGVIQPLTSQLNPEAITDLYPLPAAAARIGEDVYGLPFSADANVLVYDAEVRETPPLTWTEVLSPTSTFVFPAGSPTGLVTLQQYQALGGGLADEAGHLALDAASLAQVLDFYHTAAAAGVLPSTAADYVDAAATWIAYREDRATLAAAPASLYLREHDRAGATAATLLPTRDGTSLALGSAWIYALVATDSARQPLALALMQWLTAPDAVGEWSQAAGVLPPREAALEAWSDAGLAEFAGKVMAAAALQPDAASLAVLGPPIRQAVADAMAGRVSPQVAAERAAAAVAGQ